MTTDIANAQRARSRAGFGWGALIGTLGGLLLGFVPSLAAPGPAPAGS